MAGISPPNSSDDGASLLTGWGRTAATRARTVSPSGADEVPGFLSDPPRRGIVARGLGRSYGDAAQNAGGLVVDVTGLSTIGALDADKGLITVEAGVSLGALNAYLLARGWMIPVLPGTRHVTIGGAIAADVHGKNHPAESSFCAHLDRFRLFTPRAPRAARTVDLESDPDLFRATAGGMGLTGVLVDATLRLQPVETSFFMTETRRCPDLDDVLARMDSTDGFTYAAAWVDCMSQGRRLGRSVLTRARYASIDELPSAQRARPLEPVSVRQVGLPPWLPPGLVNAASIRAFNALWFSRAPRVARQGLEAIEEFLHPLDKVADWNRLYGRRGFIQYQFAVPDGAEGVLHKALELLSAARCPSFLSTLKRLGRAGPGLLSFTAPGWTLALDIPVGPPGLRNLLERLDQLVADGGGRVYLAKDACLRPDLVTTMYPRLHEWRRIQLTADPEGTLSSDLGRRLNLVEGMNRR